MLSGFHSMSEAEAKLASLSSSHQNLTGTYIFVTYHIAAEDEIMLNMSVPAEHSK